MQKHLVEHRAQHITITITGNRNFHSLRDSTPKAAGGSRILRIDLAADVRLHRRGRSNCCTVSPHHFTAERLLLIGYLDHEHFTVQSEICTGHRKSGAPLSGAGLGRHALKALFLCVVSLSAGGVQLVASAGVVSFKFIIDVSGCSERFLQVVCPDKR